MWRSVPHVYPHIWQQDEQGLFHIGNYISLFIHVGTHVLETFTFVWRSVSHICTSLFHTFRSLSHLWVLFTFVGLYHTCTHNETYAGSFTFVHVYLSFHIRTSLFHTCGYKYKRDLHIWKRDVHIWTERCKRPATRRACPRVSMDVYVVCLTYIRCVPLCASHIYVVWLTCICCVPHIYILHTNIHVTYIKYVNKYYANTFYIHTYNL